VVSWQKAKAVCWEAPILSCGSHLPWKRATGAGPVC
jgi:hypothetical protein